MAQQTLPLAEALADCGFAVWTPRETRVLRARRSIPKREIVAALMPGIVFAEYDRLGELIALRRSAMTYRQWDAAARRMVVRGVPFFHPMQTGERYARLSDAALGGLRNAEGVRAVAAKRATFMAGQQVRCGDGLLDGVTGKIVRIKGDFAEVDVAGWTHPMVVALRFLSSPE